MRVFVVLRCSSDNDKYVVGVYQNREDALAQCGKKKEEWAPYVTSDGYHYHYVVIGKELQ